MQEYKRSSHTSDGGNYKPREVIGSDAFNLEQLPHVEREDLRSQVISYLCEYRLAIPEFQYDYYYSLDQNGECGLYDKPGGELMREKAARCVRERRQRGQPIHRELAEVYAFYTIDRKLLSAEKGDSLLWISPPGPKEERYGDYGFVFYGAVHQTFEGGKHIRMRALRVEQPTLEASNAFLSDIVGNDIQHRSVDEMLAHPEITSLSIHPAFIYRKLTEHFHFEKNEEDQYIAEKVIECLSQALEDFVTLWDEGGSIQDVIEGLFALENEAIILRKQYKDEREEKKQGVNVIFVETLFQEAPSLAYLRDKNSAEPEKANGSCGTTSSQESSNPMEFAFGALGELFKLFNTEDSLGSRLVECPSCHRMNVRPKDKLITNCQHCGSDAIACGKKTSIEKNEQTQGEVKTS